MDNFLRLYSSKIIGPIVFFVGLILFFVSKRKRVKAENTKVIGMIKDVIKIDQIKMHHIKFIMGLVRESYNYFTGYRKLDNEEDYSVNEIHLVIELINLGEPNLRSHELFARRLHITDMGRIFWETDLGDKPIYSTKIKEYLRKEEIMV